ncbi:hypothetical protein A0J51_00982 [Gluconobacter japonicus]|nr:hypothetical protein A0J51_00982 [Gluconobacter japonicus]
MQQIAGVSAPTADRMVWNLRYSCAMARIKYYRDSASLPDASDAAGMAQYHKRVFNSPLGAANALGNILDFKAAIAA